MKNDVVRILNIKINNFKNVKYGEIDFKNRKTIKEKYELSKGDILGVYGQNGSGKTALVEVINTFKEIVLGKKLSNNVCKLISVDEQSTTIEIMFYVFSHNKKYIATYSFEITKIINKSATFPSSAFISKEKLTFSSLVNDKWKRTKTLLEFDYNEEQIIKPLYRYKEIISKDKDQLLQLNVAKELSKKISSTFLFSKETQELFKNTYDNKDDIMIIMSAIMNFARYNLFVVTIENSAYIDASLILPFSIRYEEDDNVVTGNVPIKLFGSSIIPMEAYKVLDKIVDQINIVLDKIIPDLQLELHDYGNQLLEDGQDGEKIEILSVSEGKTIPLNNESAGIKKIISILSALIAMYNKYNITVVVDELDSGIFEYLFGELLEVFDENTKGQLIFTSHNLRPLEKLDKNSIIFTTSNPENRYIKLENVKTTNNLRDFYLRIILLGGQKEDIYSETNTFEIQHALRKAGKVEGEL